MEIKRTEKSPQIIKPEESKPTEEVKKMTSQPTVDSFEPSKTKVAPESPAQAPASEKKPGQITGAILNRGLMQARLSEPGVKTEGSAKIAMAKTDVRSFPVSSERAEQIDHIRSLMSEIVQEFRTPEKVSSNNTDKRTQFSKDATNFREVQANAKAEAEEQQRLEGFVDLVNDLNQTDPLAGLNLPNPLDRIGPKSENSEKQAEFTQDVSDFRNPQKPDPTSSAQQEQVDRIRSLFREVNQELQFTRNPTTSDNSVKQNQFSQDVAAFPEIIAEAEAAAEQQRLADAANQFLEHYQNQGLNLGDIIELQLEPVSSKNSDKKAEFTESVTDFQRNQNPEPVSPDLNRIQKLLTELLASAKKLNN